MFVVVAVLFIMVTCFQAIAAVTDSPPKTGVVWFPPTITMSVFWLSVIWYHITMPRLCMASPAHTIGWTE